MAIGEQKALLDRPAKDEEALEVPNEHPIGKLAIGALLLGKQFDLTICRLIDR